MNSRKKNWLMAAGLLLLAACQTAVVPDKKEKGTAKEANNSDTVVCYAYYQNKDTALLRIHYQGNNFTGGLVYHFYEKDKNEGELTGKIKGDTLVANYTFEAEGMKSTRQVVFLKKNGNLQEGTGTITENSAGVVFNDLDSVQYNGILFTPQACQ